MTPERPSSTDPVGLGDNLGEGVEHLELLLAASKWVSQTPEGHRKEGPVGVVEILAKCSRSSRSLFIMLNPCRRKGCLMGVLRRFLQRSNRTVWM